MLQRSVSFLLPFVLIFVTVVQYKKESYTKALIIFLSYIIFIFAIGYSNYKRSDNFYFMPWQTKSDLYDYLIPAIIKERDDLSNEQAKKILNDKQENFIIEKNLNINMEKQRFEFLKFKQKYAFEIILQNKSLALKTIFINSLHSTLLNPVEQIFKSKYGSSYYKSDTHQKTIKYRIFYSVLLYSIILLGIITAIKNKYYYTYPFLLISVYFFAISSWIGYTRYFTPVLLALVIFFGIGSSVIYNKIKFKNLK